MVTTKEELARIIDELPESETHAALRYLEYLRDKGDSLQRALETAPIDDEAETPEEFEAIREALEDVKNGRTVSHEEARRRLLGNR